VDWRQYLAALVPRWTDIDATEYFERHLRGINRIVIALDEQITKGGVYVLQLRVPNAR
jgi:hypothetical protein